MCLASFMDPQPNKITEMLTHLVNVACQLCNTSATKRRACGGMLCECAKGICPTSRTRSMHSTR